LHRRKFLARCGQAAWAAFSLSQFDYLAAAPPASVQAVPDFHFHPHYREKLPLDSILLKVNPALDKFVSEKYHDKIAAILATWSSSLRQSPVASEALRNSLASNFSGASLKAVQGTVVRDGSSLKVWRNSFEKEPVSREAFIESWQSAWKPFTRIHTADFQITRIEELQNSIPGSLRTLVFYELVGSGADFHREQRAGNWEIEWITTAGGNFLAKRWNALAETVSRSAAPIFSDITEAAISGNPSYASQLLKGADDWRAVLDGACGIDIYGHNGVSLADIDNDGLDDLYVCQPAGLPNRLYRNRGDGTFEDITDRSGLGILENTACALFADFNNDGWQDVVVVRADGPSLFLNEGDGKFRKQPNAFTFSNPPQGTFTGAAVADYDRDGWLDIYFCLYTFYQGAEQYKYPLPYHDANNGPPNFLMQNRRNGTFRDVTADSDLDRNNTRYSFCCGWNDYNQDGWPDLYVVNDFGRKNLYRNNGDGTFTDVAGEVGVEDVGAGMGVCWSDNDNDGAEDLYVADMWTAAGQRLSAQEIFQQGAPEEVRNLYRKHAMGNSLFQNQTDGRFHDESEPAGVRMARWAWACDSWDFDHDGYADFYIANGMVSGPSRQDLNSFFWRQVVANSPLQPRPSHDYEQGWNALNELIRSDGTWSGYERNVFYANNRDGTFSEVSGAVGMDFLEDGRAFALADFDQDGCLEIFLKNRNGPQLRIIKNVMQDRGSAVAFRLKGEKSNRDAIGAAVTVTSELGQQIRMLQAGSGFLSQHSKELFFGLGDVKGPVRAIIRWPSGSLQEINDIPINHRVLVKENVSPPQIEPFKRNFKMQETLARSGSLRVESLPATVETWLLSPLRAPDFALVDQNGQTRSLKALQGKPVFLILWSSRALAGEELLRRVSHVHSTWIERGLQVVAMNLDDATEKKEPSWTDFPFPVVASDELAGIYNILFRYLFDVHRDLPLPTSFLIDEKGEIVKVYQGAFNPQVIPEDAQHIPKTQAERLAKGLPFAGIADNPDFRRNYLSYGSVYFQRGYYHEAAISFQSALQENPLSAEALYGIGSVYLNKGSTTEAQQAFQRVVQLHASYPETVPNAWNNLGLLSARKGDTDEARKYFGEALRINPDHLIALVNLGNLYRQQKDWEQARKILERAVTVSPEDAEANYSLGMVFAQSGDNDNAQEHLQKALQSRPEYPEALNNLGILFLKTGRRDQAVASFGQCTRIVPAFDQCYLNLARVSALEGNSEKARALLEEFLKQHPDHEQAKRALADLSK
jgi:tetratricopeptide (TPR) repeat protein/peroxiredoxin